MSKIINDLGWMPDPAEIDPRMWNKYDRFSGQTLPNGKHFTFSDNHQPWEFPLMSDLAKTQLVSYWALDEDSDMVLTAYCKLWLQDIINRSEEFQGSSLYKIAEEYQKACDYADECEANYRTFVNESWNRKIAESGLTKSEFKKKQRAEKNPLSRIYNDKDWPRTKELLKISEKANRALDGQLLKDFIRAIVENNYEVSQTAIEQYAKQLFSEKEHLDTLGVEYYIENELCTPKHSYRYHVFAFPSANLPNYFFDEMVFMNYVQTTVVQSHYQDLETAFIEDALKNGVTKDWLMKVLDTEPFYWRGWWT